MHRSWEVVGDLLESNGPVLQQLSVGRFLCTVVSLWPICLTI